LTQLSRIPILRILFILSDVRDREGAIISTRGGCAPRIDYEQEHDWGLLTHLRIMMRQFVS